MAKPKYTGLVFLDNAGTWRWHVVAKNGNLIAESGEGYKNRNVAEKMLTTVSSLCNEKDFVVESELTVAEQERARKKLAKETANQ